MGRKMLSHWFKTEKGIKQVTQRTNLPRCGATGRSRDCGKLKKLLDYCDREEMWASVARSSSFTEKLKIWVFR